MKQLVCEMCGGSDLVKQNDLYVCQHCGAKYTVEEARKMMVEGTVKLDTTEQTSKFLENARRAKQKEDWAEVEKYYNFVEQSDPGNIEAIFYSAYGKARNTLHIADYYQKLAAFEVLKKSVSILDDRFDVKDVDSVYDTLLGIEKDIRALFGCQFVYRTVKDGNGNIKESDQGKTEQLFTNVAIEFLTTAYNVADKVTAVDKALAIKIAIHVTEFVNDLIAIRRVNAEYGKDLIASIYKDIAKIDSSYQKKADEMRMDYLRFKIDTDDKGKKQTRNVGIVFAVIALASFIIGINTSDYLAMFFYIFGGLIAFFALIALGAWATVKADKTSMAKEKEELEELEAKYK